MAPSQADKASADASEPAADGVQEDTPEVATAMRNLLHSVGVQEFEPQVINMLTDFVYTYARNILQDAQAYGEAAGQPLGSVNLSDVTLAIRSRTDMSFAHAPPLEVLMGTAETMNKRELPAIRGKLGLPIPGGDQALLATNMQYKGWTRPDEHLPAAPAAHALTVPAPSALPSGSARQSEAGTSTP